MNRAGGTGPAVDEGGRGSVGPVSPARRPRVVVVTTWLPTGRAPALGSFVARDIAALSTVADLRVVHLVAPRVDDGVRRTYLGGTPVLRLPLRPTDPASLLAVAARLGAALRGADLVHSMAVSALAPVALARPGVPWVHTEHWSALAGSAAVRGALRDAAVWTAAQCERLPDRVVAVSEDLAESLRRLARRDVDVVPNIVRAPAPTRRPHRAPGEALEIIGVGGLIPRKRPLLAVDTVAALNSRGRPAALTWVGEGPEAAAMRDRAARLGVDLTLTGQLRPEEVPAHLARADVFLVPTLAETFFLGAAEALAAGRPVVVGARGGQRGFVRPPAGALVDSDDPAVWADAVERVLADSAGLGAAEIAAGVAAYTPEALAGAYARVYASLLDGVGADIPGWRRGTGVCPWILARTVDTGRAGGGRPPNS